MTCSQAGPTCRACARCGGHLLIDDPDLYEDWRFTQVSHLRISSHHRDIDKTFGKRKLPSLDDIRHLMDYVVYRVTRSNVGPWGLSRLTERRPMYLSPDLAVPHVAAAAGGRVAGLGAAPDLGGRRHHCGVAGSGGPVPAAGAGGSGE